MTRRRASGGERRRFTRVADELVVSCTPHRTPPPAVEGRTLNFSAGGVLVASPTALDAGMDVDIVLRIPGEPSDLSFPARVVRVRTLSDTHHEVAAEFVGGDAAAQRALLRFIEARATPAFDPGPQASA
jgi:c-di-GMP-binding flagellar brake protein YcgR